MANGGLWRGWGVAFAMILLSAVPVAAGTVRLVSLANGVEATPDNVRFVSSPVPVVLHVVGAMVLMVPGAFQFVPGLRRRAMGWHRWMGRLAVGAGVVVALSGLWMAQFYRLPIHDGALVYAFRLVFGAGMTYAFVKAFVAVRRRDIAGHRVDGAGVRHRPRRRYTGRDASCGRVCPRAAGRDGTGVADGRRVGVQRRHRGMDCAPIAARLGRTDPQALRRPGCEGIRGRRNVVGSVEGADLNGCAAGNRGLAPPLQGFLVA